MAVELSSSGLVVVTKHTAPQVSKKVKIYQ